MAGRTSENSEAAERVLLVFGEKEFRIKVPAGAKVTFGPWSPSSMGKEGFGGGTGGRSVGTLRIYRTEKDIIAVFSGVTGFRDVTLDYMEKVTNIESSSVWKNDNGELTREEHSRTEHKWEDPIPRHILAPASNGHGPIEEGDF